MFHLNAGNNFDTGAMEFDMQRYDNLFARWKVEIPLQMSTTESGIITPIPLFQQSLIFGRSFYLVGVIF